MWYRPLFSGRKENSAPARAIRRQRSESSSRQRSLNPPTFCQNSLRWATPKGIAIPVAKSNSRTRPRVPTWRPFAHGTVLVHEIVAEHQQVRLVVEPRHASQVVGVVLVVPVEIGNRAAHGRFGSPHFALR